MQQTVFAVVAQAVNYRDHDRILTLVTRERGTVTATARGCRKPQSKLMSCAQPAVYGEYELAEAKRQMVREKLPSPRNFLQSPDGSYDPDGCGAGRARRP